MSVVVSLLLRPSHHRVHSMHKDEKGSATSHSCCFFANDKAMQQPNSLQNSPCTFKSLSLSLSLPLSLSLFSLSGEEESDEDNAVETSESAGFSCHLVVLRSWWLLHLPQHHKLSDPDNCATVCHWKQHSAAFVKPIVLSYLEKNLSERSHLFFSFLRSVRLACCGVVFDFIEVWLQSICHFFLIEWGKVLETNKCLIYVIYVITSPLQWHCWEVPVDQWWKQLEKVPQSHNWVKVIYSFIDLLSLQ